MSMAKKIKNVPALLFVVGAGMAATPAHAILVSGSWDPAFGSAFPNLGWRGEVTYDVPQVCFTQSATTITSGTTGPCSLANITLKGAKVDFYSVSAGVGAPTLGSLNWTNPGVPSINSMFFSGGLLTGATTGTFAALVGPTMSAFPKVDDFYWALDFDAGVTPGTAVSRLAYGTLECDSKEGCGEGDAGRYRFSSKGTSVVECEFEIKGWNTGGEAVVRFAPVGQVSEPATFALALAGLSFIGIGARRRRHT